jgi:hypothetical protein
MQVFCRFVCGAAEAMAASASTAVDDVDVLMVLRGLWCREGRYWVCRLAGWG